MPVIAIAPCSKPHDYEAAVERAGGEILRLDPAVHRPADVIASADGLLLPGGGDVLPSLYGEAAHAKFAPAETGRDDYELPRRANPQRRLRRITDAAHSRPGGHAGQSRAA